MRLCVPPRIFTSRCLALSLCLLPALAPAQTPASAPCTAGWQSGGFPFGTRRHRNHAIFTFFIIRILYLQQHLVFVNAELRGFADRKQGGVFVVVGADVVDEAVGLQDVFLAQHLLGLFMLTIGAEDFAGNGFAALLSVTTGRRIHLQQNPLVITWFVFGEHGGNRDER